MRGGGERRRRETATEGAGMAGTTTERGSGRVGTVDEASNAPPSARPPLHVGLYGEPHVGKSTLAADFPTPICVGFFDRRGKELAYVKAWRKKFGPLTEKAGETAGTRWVEYRTGKRLVGRIMFFTNADVSETDGVGRMQEYWPGLVQRIDAGKWATFVGDSVSFMAYDARKQSQHVDNPSFKHAMKHYGIATDVVEEILCSMIPNLQCNTVTIMHESKVLVEAEGGMVRSPAVPGKRLASTNMVSATFPELWRLYAERDEEGKKVRRLQTQSDEAWQAGTIIGVPDGCKPKYEALWAGWEK